jgi:hypothetical protein
MVVLCIYHIFFVMLAYLVVVLHTSVRDLTKIRQKWRPLIKLYISDCANGNEFHRVHIISW